MSKKVLVSGGAGMLGSALVDRLIERGDKVFVVDDLSRGRKEFVNPKAKLIIQDLENPIWEKYLKDYVEPESLDEVFHIAALVGGVNYMLTNQIASLKNAAVDWRVLSFTNRYRLPLLYCSTACTYPIRKQTEAANHGPMQEDEALKDGAEPESIYGWCKLTGELTVAINARENDLSWKIIRMFNLYGTHEVPDEKTGHVIPALIRKAITNKPPLSVWGSGEQYRSFLFVDDAIDAIFKVMENGRPGVPYNIGSPERVKIRDLALTVLRAHKSNASYNDLQFDLTKPEGVFGRTADTTRIQSELGWTPKTSLEEGVRQTYEWCAKWIESEVQHEENILIRK
jgi:GDP-D-mannose 3', 5'-epimerase